MSEIKLLSGAFIATLVKGKDGKSNWEYTPNLAQIRKNSQKKGSMKERPQFKVIEDIEAAAAQDFRGDLKNMTLDIAKYLKNLL